MNVFFYKFIPLKYKWVCTVEFKRLSLDEKNYQVIGYTAGY